MTGIKKLTPKKIHEFRDNIYHNYSLSPRIFPWRETTEPYHIVVSEFMLQQTQVERVITKYISFTEMFPDFTALAEASLLDVLRAWQGLGYNRRAQSLRETAIRVKRDYYGILPSEPEILETFPGIGRYTAGAIAAFAFDRPVVFIETNIRSVFIHSFFADCAGIKDSDIIPLIEITLDRENPRRWYYALMDYGAELKKTYKNPARKSAHYQKQSSFIGSNRQIRGAIIRSLTANSVLPAHELISGLGFEDERTMRILRLLEKEGLVKMENGEVFIMGARSGSGAVIKNRE
ncbi:A/G-specific adenine glycosylase [bacterium]|nr:A/G-specific adenine glycosylase [bacterium]